MLRVETTFQLHPHDQVSKTGVKNRPNQYPIPGSLMTSRRQGELMAGLICSSALLRGSVMMPDILAFACFVKVKFSCWCSHLSPRQCKVKGVWWNRAMFQFFPCFAMKESPLTTDQRNRSIETTCNTVAVYCLAGPYCAAHDPNMHAKSLFHNLKCMHNLKASGFQLGETAASRLIGNTCCGKRYSSLCHVFCESLSSCLQTKTSGLPCHFWKYWLLSWFWCLKI